MILGIHGKAGSGKDTLCQMVMAHAFLLGSGCRSVMRMAFADKLKSLLGTQLFDLSYAQMYTEEGKSAVDPRYGVTPRHILQRCGMAAREIHDNIWVEAVLRGSESLADSLMIIPDVRFPNEFAAIRERDGMIVRIIRPGVLIEGHDHPSETALDHLPGNAWDMTYVNNGTLKDLEAFAVAIIDTLSWRFPCQT